MIVLEAKFFFCLYVLSALQQSAVGRCPTMEGSYANESTLVKLYKEGKLAEIDLPSFRLACFLQSSKLSPTGASTSFFEDVVKDVVGEVCATDSNPSKCVYGRQEKLQSCADYPDKTLQILEEAAHGWFYRHCAFLKNREAIRQDTNCSAESAAWVQKLKSIFGAGRGNNDLAGKEGATHVITDPLYGREQSCIDHFYQNRGRHQRERSYLWFCELMQNHPIITAIITGIIGFCYFVFGTYVCNLCFGVAEDTPNDGSDGAGLGATEPEDDPVESSEVVGENPAEVIDDAVTDAVPVAAEPDVAAEPQGRPGESSDGGENPEDTPNDAATDTVQVAAEHQGRSGESSDGDESLAEVSDDAALDTDPGAAESPDDPVESSDGDENLAEVPGDAATDAVPVAAEPPDDHAKSSEVVEGKPAEVSDDAAPDAAPVAAEPPDVPVESSDGDENPAEVPGDARHEAEPVAEEPQETPAEGLEVEKPADALGDAQHEAESVADEPSLDRLAFDLWTGLRAGRATVAHAMKILSDETEETDSLRHLAPTVLQWRITGTPEAIFQGELRDYSELLSRCWEQPFALLTLVLNQICARVEDLDSRSLLSVLKVASEYSGYVSREAAATLLRRSETLLTTTENAELAQFIFAGKPVSLALVAKAAAHEPNILRQLVSVLKILGLASENATMETVLNEAIGAWGSLEDIPPVVSSMFMDTIASMSPATIYVTPSVMNFLRGIFSYNLRSADVADVAPGIDWDEWARSMRKRERSVASDEGFFSTHMFRQFVAILGDTPECIGINLIRLLVGLASQVPEENIYRLIPARIVEGRRIPEEVSVGWLLLRFMQCEVKPGSDNRAILLRLWQTRDPAVLRDPDDAAALANCFLCLTDNGTKYDGAAMSPDIFIVAMASDLWRELIGRVIPPDKMSRWQWEGFENFMGYFIFIAYGTTDFVFNTTSFYAQLMFDRIAAFGSIPYPGEFDRMMGNLSFRATECDARTRRLLAISYVAQSLRLGVPERCVLARIEGREFEDMSAEQVLATFMEEHSVDIPDAMFKRISDNIAERFPSYRLTPSVTARLELIAANGKTSG
jgi:hypothetical protein